MDDETRAALERAKMALMKLVYIMPIGADQTTIDDLTAAARTSVPAIDELLPYATTDDPQETVQVRYFFLDRILQAANEPLEEESGRATIEKKSRRVKRVTRRDQAADAAECLRKAATLLSDLDNRPLANTLEQLAGIVQQRASTSRISAVMNTEGIVPGMFVRPAYQMRHGSSALSGAGGATSRRADIIRFVCRFLSDDAPNVKIARLITEVLGIECAPDNVKSALSEREARKRSEKKAPADAAATDLQAAMHLMAAHGKS
jgi:hypothetical protein